MLCESYVGKRTTKNSISIGTSSPSLIWIWSGALHPNSAALREHQHHHRPQRGALRLSTNSSPSLPLRPEMPQPLHLRRSPVSRRCNPSSRSLHRSLSNSRYPRQHQRPSRQSLVLRKRTTCANFAGYFCARSLHASRACWTPLTKPGRGPAYCSPSSASFKRDISFSSEQ